MNRAFLEICAEFGLEIEIIGSARNDIRPELPDSGEKPDDRFNTEFNPDIEQDPKPAQYPD
jgi:hypothetical protein